MTTGTRVFMVLLAAALVIPAAACSITPPTIPTPKIPEFKPPDIKIPDIKPPDIRIPEIKIPEIPSFDPEYVDPNAPKPQPPGTPLKLTFEASLPPSREPVRLNVNGTEYAMKAVTDYLFTSPEVPAASGDTVRYFYASGNNVTATLTATPTSARPIRNGLAWTTSEKLSRPGFIKGHTVMDTSSGVNMGMKSGKTLRTMEAMKADGGEWFAFDYYWNITDPEKPEMEDGVNLDPGYPTGADLVKMMTAAREKGLKFMLFTELEWNLRQDEWQGISSDEGFRKLNERWAKGQEVDQRMADRLQANPADPAAGAYWDRWFAQFEIFILKAARAAEEGGAGALSLGKQLNGAMYKGNEARWRALIGKVRQVYRGKITQVVFYSGYTTTLENMPWADGLDFVTVYYYNNFSEKERPSLDELEAKMKEFNRTQFAPFYARYKKPIVMLNAFQSRDHAAKQEWFEPYLSQAATTSIGRDYIGQADLYEAFFRSTLNEPWLGGVVTWGYWLEADYNPKYSFDKSSTVRNKPAALVVQRWFSPVQS